MSDRRPLVIQTEHLSESAAAWLAERVELTRCASDSPEFERLLPDVEGLVIRTYTTVDRALLDRAPRLRVVGRAGVGVDNIDLEACAERGVEVVFTPDANTGAVVEFVYASLLDALRPRPIVREPMPLDEWNKLRNDSVGRRQLDELTIGIYGLGRIGRRVAALASAAGMSVIYHDVLEIPPVERCGAEPVSRDELLTRSDVITLHVDGRSSNRHLIDAAALARVKPNLILINTSRGFIVNPAALAEFLSAKPNAQARLDVHEPEPLPADHPLLRLKNAFLTPHIAGRTERAMERMSEVVYDIVDVLEGRTPRWSALIRADH